MREWEEQILSHIKNMLFYLVFLNVNIYIFNTTIVMIDDKKIEEAARYYCNNRYPASQDAPFIAEGFRLGAKWAVNELLKDLWHPAIEEPEKNHFILFKTADNSFETEYIGKNDWATIVRCFKVVKWFYIDDLFPNEGGEQ